MTIARLQRAADQLAAVKVANAGYDQSQRRTFYDQKTLRLRPGGELDCSMGCGWIAAQIAGELLDLADPFWSANFVRRLVETGLWREIKFAGLSQVRPGDFVAGPGHVVFARDRSRWWSAESDERGRSSGGKAGWQPGEKVGYRKPYLRSRGWTSIVRLVSPSVLLRQALDAHAAGKSPAKALRLLRHRAPWDGPRWTWAFDLWSQWDKGMTLAFTPGAITVPGDQHAFVVLGTALSPAGKPTAKFFRRLELAVDALTRFPHSKVLITGGAPRAGVTEAAVGRSVLVQAGIDPDRILIEDKSSSTVGNAKYSVPILRAAGVTSYTLVSHATHLRRAALLFLARRVQLETVVNRQLDLELDGLLAVDDYSPKPVKPRLPIEPASRRAIAGEVKSLLGL